MPKRNSRPWESRGVGRSTEALPFSKKNSVSSVTVDGISYLSDRFYLHRPDGVDGNPMHACTCGVRPPPLLDRDKLVKSLELRAAIVATYTMSPDWAMHAFPALFDGSIPTLVLHGMKELSNRVGRKQGSSLETEQAGVTSPLLSSVVRDSIVSEQTENISAKTTTNLHLSHKTEFVGKNEVICIDSSSDEDNDETIAFDSKAEPVQSVRAALEPEKSQRSFTNDLVTSTTTLKGLAENNSCAQQAYSESGLSKKLGEEEEVPPEEGWRRMGIDQTKLLNLPFGKSVHLTEISPAWLPPDAIKHRHTRPTNVKKCTKKAQNDDAIVIHSDDDYEEEMTVEGVTPAIATSRRTMQGVHHPKFMILFEKRGSVVIIVSTGNISRPTVTDASWIQRFEPSTQGMRDSTRKLSDEMRRDGSDFGYVLADFLQCQSDAAKEKQMLPVEFLRRYLSISSLVDFRRSFRFEDSHVHLIATVPGNRPGRHSSKHLGKSGKSRSFLYGPQRVADILFRLGNSSDQANEVSIPRKSWLPDSILSDHDRLVVQQTSFGGNWQRENLAEIGRSYFGCDDLRQNVSANTRRDDKLLERMDILWPSQDFMNIYAHSQKKETSPGGSPTLVPGVAATATKSSSISRNKAGTSAPFLFLSSKSFNTIDVSCLSRMSLYGPSIPEQIPCVQPPHIKTYSRMFDGNDFNLRQEYGFGKAEELFSWVMLSSACLSRGAQGKPLPHRGFESDEMTYSNFELGVMFCSRLQGLPNRDRLYCWKPSKCMCERSKKYPTEASLVHLPFPHCLRPSPYQNDPDEANFGVTPYFHEIPQGTGSVGQMALTPLGAKLASARL